MTFNLRVPADGWANEEMHSRDNSLIDSNLSDVGSAIMPFPKEFDISPSTGTIAPQGELDIKVMRMLFKKYFMFHRLPLCRQEVNILQYRGPASGVDPCWLPLFKGNWANFQNDSEIPRN